MTTLIVSHPACLAHDPGPGHPENAARLAAVLDMLHLWHASHEGEGGGASPLAWADAPEATLEALSRAHDAAYVEAVLDAVPADGYVRLDPDTAIGPMSGEAALRAAGAVVAAVDAVIEGRAANAFCAVRPPGHHAERARAMGFCLFNNVAVGALHARAAHGLERIAVVDFDVHHGNGTEAIFRDDDGLFFASSHQFPFYPGTGSGAEDNAHIVNLPLPANAGGGRFRDGWRERILPALAAFGPDMILISAGFDGHRRDPLASLGLDEDDFAWVTGEIRAAAEASCAGRIVSTFEGGYFPEAVAASALAHVRALAETRER